MLSFAFVSQVLLSSLRPIAWNILWRKGILNNFKTVIKKYQKSVIVGLLALLQANKSQRRKFCVLQVKVLLSSLAQLKDFARTKSWSRLDLLIIGCCTIPLPSVRAYDFKFIKVDVWSKMNIPAFRWGSCGAEMLPFCFLSQSLIWDMIPTLLVMVLCCVKWTLKWFSH